MRGAENPSLSRVLPEAPGWAYYLDAFSSYPLRTWLPSVYRGHDNCPTLGTYYGPRWRRADIQSGISLTAQAPSEGGLLRLPPKLRVQVVRIFTDMSISPSLSPRQCPDRYAFRAGRNLPDKEVRVQRQPGGERSTLEESTRESSGGRSGSENVGLSNANIGENPMPRKPKGSSARFVHGGPCLSHLNQRPILPSFQLWCAGNSIVHARSCDAHFSNSFTQPHQVRPSRDVSGGSGASSARRLKDRCVRTGD
ncbi:hypothetical protein SAY86_013212 [Trapa natans]|uniref:Uncharacterized protein n=1 Tax=Trapa natans TaxID=22666 RepID=A0AAN7ME34_TRANT|nr:hypothetical protein SAY86_013212 [Trapa natans]